MVRRHCFHVGSWARTIRREPVSRVEGYLLYHEARLDAMAHGSGLGRIFGSLVTLLADWEFLEALPGLAKECPSDTPGVNSHSAPGKVEEEIVIIPRERFVSASLLTVIFSHPLPSALGTAPSSTPIPAFCVSVVSLIF